MTRVVLLDSGPLGLLVHPRQEGRLLLWAAGLLEGGSDIAIPEIANYELRRELLRLDRQAALKRLDELVNTWTYAPITTRIILHAAHLWADVRRRGKPTADDRALDVDVILAATALELLGGGDDRCSHDQHRASQPVRHGSSVDGHRAVANVPGSAARAAAR